MSNADSDTKTENYRNVIEEEESKDNGLHQEEILNKDKTQENMLQTLQNPDVVLETLAFSETNSSSVPETPKPEKPYEVIHGDGEVIHDDGEVIHDDGVDIEHVEEQINTANIRLRELATNVVDNQKSWTTKRKALLVGGIVLLCMIVTAVVVPTVLLLGKEEVQILPEGEDHWIECPFKDGAAKEVGCLEKKCIWRPSRLPWPSCFFPPEKSHYKVSSDYNGQFVQLQSTNDVKIFEAPVQIVTVQVDCSHASILTVKIYPGPTGDNNLNNSTCNNDYNKDYRVELSSSIGNNFELVVLRNSTNETVQVVVLISYTWNSRLAGLVVEKRFIQIGSFLNSPYIYGMAENNHGTSLRRELDMKVWPLFSRSPLHRSTKTQDHLNLNSVHPFYMNLNENGAASGVLFKTSFPSEYILLKSPGIVFRALDEQLEFKIFVGRSPKHVSQLLREVIGGPSLPPIWSLGLHIAPTKEPEKLVNLMAEKNIPVDSVHLSLSLWEKEMVFDSDKNKSSMFSFIKNDSDINWVLTLSPMVPVDPNYYTYSQGLLTSSFVKCFSPNVQDCSPPEVQDKTVMYGKSESSLIVAYFDYDRPSGTRLWKESLESLPRIYDGFLTISNEPFNLDRCTEDEPNCWKLECGPDDSPPYPTAAGLGEEVSLSDGTLCMTGQHGQNPNEISHLAVHNLYGINMALKTYQFYSKTKRCLVMSHSTSYLVDGSTPSGTIAKFLENTETSWESLRRSLTSILEFNLLGIPMVVADICGLSANSNEKLCGRWWQLGAFYPLARIKEKGVPMSEKMETLALKSLRFRFSLSSYTYSSLYLSQEEGEPLLRPLFYEFPNDSKAKEIDTQFMYGPSIMVAPVFDQKTDKEDKMTVYFPNETWYRLIGDSSVIVRSKPGYNPVSSIDEIPLFVRAGHIIPFHFDNENKNVKSTLNSPVTLRVFPKDLKASGFLYTDDGISKDHQESGNHYFFEFEYEKCEFRIHRKRSFTGVFPRQLLVSQIIIYDWEVFDSSLIQNGRVFFSFAPGMNSSDNDNPDFGCKPVHDHKILELQVDIDLKENVQNNLWIIDWSDKNVCPHHNNSNNDCL